MCFSIECVLYLTKLCQTKLCHWYSEMRKHLQISKALLKADHIKVPKPYSLI